MPRGNAIRLGPFEDLGPVDQSSDAPVLEHPELQDLGPVPGGSLPAGMKPTGEASPADPNPPRTLIERATDHFLGKDDPNDPVPMPRLAASIIGAMGGGLMAAEAVPTSPTLVGAGAKAAAGFAGSVVGAVSGAAAPETTMALLHKVGLVSEQTQRKYTIPLEQLKPYLENEAILDIATSGGVGLARIFGRNLTRAMTMGRVNPEADQIANIAAKHGVEMLPIQLGQSTIPRMFISVFGRMPWLAGPYLTAAKDTQARLLQAIKEVPESVAPAVAASDVSMRAFRAAKSTVTDIANYYDRVKADLLAKADQTGIKVGTYETVHHAQDVLDEIKRVSPTGAARGNNVSIVSPELSAVRDFINKNILPMAVEGPKSIKYTSQSLTQMDTLRKMVSDQMLKTKDEKALSLLKNVENGLNADMLANAQGPQAKEAVQNFLHMDEQRANALNDVFNTATANRFQQVIKGGLAGGDKTTTKSMDELADVLTKTENPSSVAELVKLTERDPEALQGLTRNVLDQKVLGSMTAGSEKGAKFDVGRFSDSLGLDNKTGNTYQYMKKLLDASGGIKMNELEDLTKVAEKVGSVEIPNYNTFLVRKTAIGGIRSGINAMIPGAAFAGGAAGSSFVFGPGALVVAGMFVLGSRGFSAMISNPASARALRTVMSKEVSDGVRRAAFIKSLRLGLAAAQDRGINTDQDLHRAYEQGISMVVDGFDQYYQQFKNRGR